MFKDDDRIEQDDLEQVRELLELTHGDLLRTAFLVGVETGGSEYLHQAEGVRRSLAIVEQLEGGEWDADLVSQAMADVSVDEDPHVDAESLRDLSRYARRDDVLVTDHPLIQRITTDVTPRGYWDLLKDFLGVGHRV